MRLTDIPLNVRLNAAHVACRREPDDDERVEILLAAIRPSDTTYWVAP